MSSLPETPSIAVTIDDFSVNNIEAMLQEYLARLDESIPALEQEKKRLIRVIELGSDDQSMTPLKKSFIENRVKQLSRDLDTAKFKLDYYQTTIVPARDRLRGIKKKIVFGQGKNRSKTPFSSDQQNRIREYLNVVGKVVDVVVDEPVERITFCPVCRQELQRDANSLVCVSCGQQLEACTFSVNSDTEDIRYRNDDNFVKALRIFQGKESVKLPTGWERRLDDYFKSKGFPSREEILEQPLNDDGTRGNTNRKILREALKATNMPYYAEMNYIGHSYWGWQLPDLSDWEENIIAQYNELEQYYHECLRELGIQASSSLNMSYRLYKQLELIGYQCSCDDFDISPSDEMRQKYEQIWRLMCSKAGLPYIPTRWC